MFPDLFCCGANDLQVQTQVKYIIISTFLLMLLIYFFLIQWIKSITWHLQLHLQTTCTIPSKPWKPTQLALLTCLVSTCIYGMNILLTLFILNVLHRIVLCLRSQISEMRINVDLLFYWMRVKPVWPVSSPWRKLCDVFHATHDPKHSDTTW